MKSFVRSCDCCRKWYWMTNNRLLKIYIEIQKWVKVQIPWLSLFHRTVTLREESLSTDKSLSLQNVDTKSTISWPNRSHNFSENPSILIKVAVDIGLLKLNHKKSWYGFQNNNHDECNQQFCIFCSLSPVFSDVNHLFITSNHVRSTVFTTC